KIYEIIRLSFLRRPDDGLEREFKFFKWLEGGVCTTCAPRDTEKSMEGKLRSLASRRDLQRASSVSNQKFFFGRSSYSLCLRVFQLYRRKSACGMALTFQLLPIKPFRA